MINGHVYPEADKTPEIRYRQPRLFYWHVGGGKFKDLSTQAGSGVSTRLSSRGSAVGDLDNDGSLEIVVSNMGARPSLLEEYGNRSALAARSARWRQGNRDAIGARVVVQAADRRLSGEVQSGSSYISQNDSRIHVGLATSETFDRIEVQWPGGAREQFPGGKADRVVTLTEGQGTSLPPRAGGGGCRAGPSGPACVTAMWWWMPASCGRMRARSPHRPTSEPSRDRQHLRHRPSARTRASSAPAVAAAPDSFSALASAVRAPRSRAAASPFSRSS